MSRFLAAILVAAFAIAAQAQVQDNRMIGINVLLNQPASEAILADLGAHGRVLDVIPEIHAVTLRASSDKLAAIRSLPYVQAADPDAPCTLAGGDGQCAPDFSDGVNHWSLDAINVTDFAGGRTVDYSGAGVYVAVIDTGLPHNWREYFPEGRIATQFARAFSGGGGNRGAVTSAPDAWEHDTNGHGTGVAGIILGFRYLLEQPALPAVFNGVAPGVTIIPLKTSWGDLATVAWLSTDTRAILYVAELKASGALGDSPVVINA